MTRRRWPRRGEDAPAFRLKEHASAYSWTDAERARVNDTGFSLLPAGERIGWFTGADGLYAGLWTATAETDESAWVRYFVFNPVSGNNGKIWRDSVDKNRAYSVRCILSAPSASRPPAAQKEPHVQ